MRFQKTKPKRTPRKNMKKILNLLLFAALTALPAQAVQVFLRPSAAVNMSQPGLPDVTNEDVQNELYTQNVTVLPGTLLDSHYNLEITVEDDQGNPIDITSITSLTRTVSTNQTGSTFTWNGAIYAPDTAAAPVAQTYNAAGVNNTASASLWYSQVVGTDLTNKAVREIVISGAAIDSATLGGAYFSNNPGFVQTVTWTVTANGVTTSAASNVSVIPEPGSVGLIGLLSIGLFRRKRSS